MRRLIAFIVIGLLSLVGRVGATPDWCQGLTVISGQVTTCPADGSPPETMIGANVTIYAENGTSLGTYPTDENGFWCLGLSCPNQFITAKIGNGGCNAAGCCRQATMYVGCDNVAFPDLRFPCKICPHHQ